jgi:hypothetical protein
VKTAGYVAADGRLFVGPPKYAGQDQGTGVSLVVEPEVAVETEDSTHKATLRPFYRLDPVDQKRSHADLRQASYQLKTTHFELGAGAGIFTWGVLESYRPVDVLNQTDFVDDYDGSAKLGQPYIELGWIAEAVAVRVYYLPYFRERTFPGVDGRLRFASVVNTDDPLFETDLRQWQPSGAARVTWSPGDFDFGVGLFSGFSREPRFVAELSTGRVVPRYDLSQQASLDAQWTTGALSLKAEAFARLWTADLRFFSGGGAGLDYTFFGLVDGWDLSLAAEFLFDTRPLQAPVTLFEHDAFAGLRVAFNDTASTEIIGGAIVDVTDGTTFGRLEAGRRFGEHWRATVGGMLFLGQNGKLDSSFVRDDHFETRIAYFF